MKDNTLLIVNSNAFQLLPLIGLIENSTCPNLMSGSAKETRTRCPSNPTRYTAPLSLNIGF